MFDSFQLKASQKAATAFNNDLGHGWKQSLYAPLWFSVANDSFVGGAISPLHAPPTLGISSLLNKSCLGLIERSDGELFLLFAFKCFQSIQRLLVNATELLSQE
jgi:hypothetical protein